MRSMGMQSGKRWNLSHRRNAYMISARGILVYPSIAGSKWPNTCPLG
jgi:hypothetical protein